MPPAILSVFSYTWSSKKKRACLRVRPACCLLQSRLWKDERSYHPLAVSFPSSFYSESCTYLQILMRWKCCSTSLCPRSLEKPLTYGFWIDWRGRSTVPVRTRKLCVGIPRRKPERALACTTRVRKTELRTTPVRSQQCERQQCEGVNSANETRVRISNVRMPAVRCDIGAKKVLMPTVRIAFFLFTDSDWIWTERKKGASENLNAQSDMLSHSNWPFFSSPSPSRPWLQCLCLCKLMCQFKRGKGNGKALVDGAVLQHYWVGEEDRRKLVSAIPDFRAVVGIPRSKYSPITTKSKMATPRMKKSFW